ncbi:hypothetical protein IKG31_00355 [Candidatus Saccharibacteria bacterium]|nr:hypothetical protein [Candidatus Saccharibacteria bacterium]
MDKKVAPNNPSGRVCKAGYTKIEQDCATNFLKYLYDLWRKHEKDEIMELDKTIYDNEEPVNAN